MRVVLDTNVLIAAFIAHGVCNELLEHCALNHESILSRFILDEFRRTMLGKFHFPAGEVEQAVMLLESRISTVEPSNLDTPLCRDPNDDMIIGTALAASCDCIVTGDKDLLDLSSVSGISIVAPSAFWELETS